jgi:hypothetical protein
LIGINDKDKSSIAHSICSVNVFRESKSLRRLFQKMKAFTKSMKPLQRITKRMVYNHLSAKYNDPDLDYNTSSEEEEERERSQATKRVRAAQVQRKAVMMTHLHWRMRQTARN